MRLVKINFIVIIFTIISFNGMAYSQEGDLSPLGFKFGIDKKEAKKVIDSKGKRIVMDEEDSKEMIVIVMQGVIVNLPIDISGKDVMTELEFYKKKLLATSLIFAATDENEKAAIESDFVQHFTSEYGEPVERETVMHFTTTSWDIPEVKLVMYTDNKDNTVKIQYKHIPGHQAKFEEELDEKRGTVKTDPATQMFLEGDYSKPTGYDEQYGTK
jgi:hypothetical protein